MPQQTLEILAARPSGASSSTEVGPLARSLTDFPSMSGADHNAIEELSSGITRIYPACADIVREGDRPRSAFLIHEGWACRYKTLPNGRRQILAILLPGDVCDLNIDLMGAFDHSIGTLTAVRASELAPEHLRAAMCSSPRLIEAFYWKDMVCHSIQREWVLNLGQRTALERVAHLLCELFVRLQRLDMVRDCDIRFPLKQADLADATGLTTVHTNRMLKELRADGLIRLKSRTLVVPNLLALKQAGLFVDTYLHLRHRDSARSAFGWD